jgi:hypothetical protein
MKVFNEVFMQTKYTQEQLETAVQRRDAKALTELVMLGADFSNVEYDGLPMLHWAAKNGHKELVSALIEKGADVNAKNKDGETPLDLAHGEVRKALKQAAEAQSKVMHAKLKLALDAQKETEEVKKAIKEVVANPYFKDLGDLRKHPNIERLYAPLKEHAKAHPEDTAKNKMAARVEGVVYGRVTGRQVSNTLDRLYDDMYRESKHTKDKKVPKEKQDRLRDNAWQSMANTMNVMLNTHNLIMGVKIEYNKETKKLEAKYEENPELRTHSSYGVEIGASYYGNPNKNIDTMITQIKSKHNWSQKSIDDGVAHLTKLKEGIQANLDKMNKALDDSVQDAVKKAENPETHKSMKRKKVGLICGIVASVVVGVALIATGIGVAIAAPITSAGLIIGGISGGTFGGMAVGIGGSVGFGSALECLRNRAGKEEAIKFGREASEICNDLVSTFKEMNEEVKAAPAPEKKEAVGKFTAAVTGTTTEPQVEMPDMKPMEELISGMAKQLKALTKEVAEARKDAAAARQEATEARREVDDVKSTMLGGAAKVTNVLRQSMYQLETAASAARTLREPAIEATVIRQ